MWHDNITIGAAHTLLFSRHHLALMIYTTSSSLLSVSQKLVAVFLLQPLLSLLVRSLYILVLKKCNSSYVS